MMRRVLVAGALLLGGAVAQAQAQAVAQEPSASAAAACPLPGEVELSHLLGLWRAEFEGLPGATLLIERHPGYVLSFAGGINRNGERGRVVGDVEDGSLTLEESADGQRIAATWLGEVVEGSCGHEFRGTWQATGSEKLVPFVLKKLPGR